MKPSILLIISLFFTGNLIVHAQERDCEESFEDSKGYKLLSDEQSAKIPKIVARRNNNEEFMRQTLSYAIPSFVTFPTIGMQGGPKSPYILTADIKPNFVIGDRRLPFAVHVTPGFQVRLMYNNKPQGDSSFPVRTPSYMPGITAFLPLFKTHFAQTRIFPYASLAVFHHSNGQDAPALRYDSATGRTEVNTYNGNFSTNFIEPGINLRFRTEYKLVDPLCFCSAQPYNDHVFHLGIEQHFAGDETLRPAYGNTRINFAYQFINVHSYCNYSTQEGHKVPLEAGRLRERFRAILQATYIAGSRNRDLNAFDNRLNLDVQFHWHMRGSPNLSVFTGGGYFGSDTYNIYFEKRYWYFRLGLGMGFFVAPGFIGN